MGAARRAHQFHTAKFKALADKGVTLQNIVYYRSTGAFSEWATHYFVMTGSLASLVAAPPVETPPSALRRPAARALAPAPRPPPHPPAKASAAPVLYGRTRRERRPRLQRPSRGRGSAAPQADLQLLRGADAFVGTAASFTSRLALLAIAGESGALPAFELLDRPLGQLWFA